MSGIALSNKNTSNKHTSNKYTFSQSFEIASELANLREQRVLSAQLPDRNILLNYIADGMSLEEIREAVEQAYQDVADEVLV